MTFDQIRQHGQRQRAQRIRHRYRESEQNKRQNAVAWAIGLAILVVVVPVLFAIFSSSRSEKSSSRPSESENNSIDIYADKVRIGGDGILRMPGGENIPVATTVAAYERMNTLLYAHDTDGVARMVLMGHVVLVPNGTQVRVISRPELYAREVKILSGNQTGRYVFVSEDVVKPR